MFKATRALLLGAAITTLVPSVRAAESFAQSVLSYTAGSGVGAFTNPTAALGKPAANVGGSVFSPFNPHFSTSELVRIGEGGQLTLQLANYVLVTPTARELGIWENVGLSDANYPNGNTGATASPFGADSAVVEVSADNISWFALNGGAPILFTLPGNYYANSTSPFATAAPANPVLADFGKPFTGALSNFDNENYTQVLATLDGSAGGTWLDLDSTGLTQVGYVRFSGVAAGQTLELNAVAINGAQIGAAVPEPGTLALAASGLLLAGLWRKRKTKTALLAALALSLLPGARAATITGFTDIQFWVGSGPNRAGLVIDWQDGKTAPGDSAGQALAWGYQWQNGASPTGLDMLSAIAAADPRLHLSIANNPSFGAYVFGIGYDLDGNGSAFTFHPAFPESATGEAADHLGFGFDTNGYWEYVNAVSNSATAPTGSGWGYATVGAGARTLVANAWDGWVFSSYSENPDFTFLPPSPALAAVQAPEPASATLLLLVGAGWLAKRRRG